MVQEQTSKAKKGVAFNYKGPPAYLIQPNRTDPFADPNNVVQSRDGTNQPIDWGYYTPSTCISQPLRVSTRGDDSTRATPASLLQRDQVSIPTSTSHHRSTASANTLFSTNSFTDKETSTERWTSVTSPEDELLVDASDDKVNKDDEVLDLEQNISLAQHKPQSNCDTWKGGDVMTRPNRPVNADHISHKLHRHTMARISSSPPDRSDGIHDCTQFPTFEDQLDFQAKQCIIRANLIREEHISGIGLLDTWSQHRSNESDTINKSYEPGISPADCPAPTMNDTAMPPYNPHSVMRQSQGEARARTFQCLEERAEQSARKEKARQEERRSLLGVERERRRVRDQKEMLAGLTNSKKPQRGWNGEHENVRQETTQWHLQRQKRQSETQQNEGMDVELSTPSKKKKRMTISELTNASEELRNRREVERLLLEDEAQNATEAAHAHMMAAKWDPDTIRESAIIERRLKDAKLAERSSRHASRIRRHQGRSNLMLQGTSQTAAGTQTSQSPDASPAVGEASVGTIKASPPLVKNKPFSGAMTPTQSLTSDEISGRAISLFQTLINQRPPSTTSPSAQSLANDNTRKWSSPRSSKSSDSSSSSWGASGHSSHSKRTPSSV